MIRVRVVTAIVASGVVLGTVPSCQVLFGFEHFTEGSGDASTCSASVRTSSPECSTCTERQCCDAAVACKTDSNCAQAFDCLAKCAGGDEACRAGCATRNSEALAKLVACQAGECGAPCGLSCGGVAGLYLGRYVTRSEACRKCLAGPLCSVETTCASAPVCLELLGCRNDCDPLDSICRAACTPTYRGGDQSELSVRQALGTCAAACNLGQNFECVGSVSWPSATARNITFRFQVFASSGHDGSGLDGADVRACSSAAGDCQVVAGPTKSASNGGVALQLPTVRGPFDGYFEITSAKDGLVPTLWTQYPYPNADNPVSDYFPFFVTAITETTLTSLATDAKVTLDPSRGTVLVLPYDCDGNPASGISLSLSPTDPVIVPFYLDDGGHADTTATATNAATATGPEGGFFQVPPGIVTVTASTPDKAVVSRVSAVVRAGAVTLLEIVPTP